jgi:ubiquinone/menaquinone biosynthesis C-methylase UbiE
MDLSQLELNRVDLEIHRRIYQWAAHQFDPGWVLDVGSELGVGMGLMQAENPDLKLIGCDVNGSNLKESKSFMAGSALEMIQADGARLPHPTEFLTGICLINILHLVKEPEAILRETWRSLRYGGRVAVFVDLSKLPVRWEANQLGTHLDGLLKSRFQLTGQADGLAVAPNIFSLQNISRTKIYLRLGTKR